MYIILTRLGAGITATGIIMPTTALFLKGSTGDIFAEGVLTMRVLNMTAGCTGMTGGRKAAATRTAGIVIIKHISNI
jgi:hypothetical protein